MRVKLFTFRYSPTLGGFDDTPLQDFVRDKDVLGFREHFFRSRLQPQLSLRMDPGGPLERPRRRG